MKVYAFSIYVVSFVLALVTKIQSICNGKTNLAESYNNDNYKISSGRYLENLIQKNDDNLANDAKLRNLIEIKFVDYVQFISDFTKGNVDEFNKNLTDIKNLQSVALMDVFKIKESITKLNAMINRITILNTRNPSAILKDKLKSLNDVTLANANTDLATAQGKVDLYTSWINGNQTAGYLELQIAKLIYPLIAQYDAPLCEMYYNYLSEADVYAKSLEDGLATFWRDVTESNATAYAKYAAWDVIINANLADISVVNIENLRSERQNLTDTLALLNNNKTILLKKISEYNAKTNTLNVELSRAKVEMIEIKNDYDISLALYNEKLASNITYASEIIAKSNLLSNAKNDLAINQFNKAQMEIVIASYNNTISNLTNNITYAINKINYYTAESTTYSDIITSLDNSIIVLNTKQTSQQEYVASNISSTKSLCDGATTANTNVVAATTKNETASNLYNDAKSWLEGNITNFEKSTNDYNNLLNNPDATAQQLSLAVSYISINQTFVNIAQNILNSMYSVYQTANNSLVLAKADLTTKKEACDSAKILNDTATSDFSNTKDELTQLGKWKDGNTTLMGYSLANITIIENIKAVLENTKTNTIAARDTYMISYNTVLGDINTKTVSMNDIALQLQNSLNLQYNLHLPSAKDDLDYQTIEYNNFNSYIEGIVNRISEVNTISKTTQNQLNTVNTNMAQTSSDINSKTTAIQTLYDGGAGTTTINEEIGAAYKSYEVAWANYIDKVNIYNTAADKANTFRNEATSLYSLYNTTLNVKIQAQNMYDRWNNAGTIKNYKFFCEKRIIDIPTEVITLEYEKENFNCTWTNTDNISAAATLRIGTITSQCMIDFITDDFKDELKLYYAGLDTKIQVKINEYKHCVNHLEFYY